MIKIILLLFIPGISFAETSLPIQDALKTFVKVYLSSRTYNDLYQKLDQGGYAIKLIHEQLLEVDSQSKLPRISYDFNKLEISFAGQSRIQFSEKFIDRIKINGHHYRWNRDKTLFLNFVDLLDESQPIHSRNWFFDYLLPKCFAQNRDFFPKGPTSDRISLSDVVMMAGTFRGGPEAGANVVAAGLPSKYMIESSRLKRLVKTSKWGGIGLVTATAYYGVNKAHAYLAPSCRDQIARLKILMNANQISLAGLDCRSIYHSNKSIEFWTPDRQKLSFFADWTSSQVFIGDETYKFGHDRLEKVFKERGGAIQTVQDERTLDVYRKNLEPYRKVLFAMGTANSCYKCEEDFKKNLIQEKPGRYPYESGYGGDTPGVIQ